MSTTQEATEHQFLVDLSKHLVQPGLYFMSKPNDTPCMLKQISSHNEEWQKFLLLRAKPENYPSRAK